MLKNKTLKPSLRKYPRDLTKKEKVELANRRKTKHKEESANTYSQTPETGRKILIDLIKFSKAKNLVPVLVTTPQSYLYNERVSVLDYKKRIYENLEMVYTELNEKPLYLDYSHDERFVNNLEFFFDDNHLNEKGAKIFTDIVFEDLKENKLLK